MAFIVGQSVTAKDNERTRALEVAGQTGIVRKDDGSGDTTVEFTGDIPVGRFVIVETDDLTAA
jgi:hypothetical protein